VKYVSVHHHSTFSFMDGYGTPETHVTRAVELGMSALALTEHGNVSSHVRLEKAAKKHGIKPIFGSELYTAPEKTRQKWHLTALAETQEGYLNLNRLVSAAWRDGFYQWPTVHGSMLQEFGSGLIVTSGCSDSLLSCTLLGGKSNGPKRDRASASDFASAEKVVRKFQNLFGEGYYLEVQQFPELERTRTLNTAFAELSARTGVPLVATADCHYPFSDDNEMQKILHAAGRGNNSIDEQEAEWEYNIRLTHPISDKFIIDRLIGTGLTRKQALGAIASTAEIAERCSVVLPHSERIRFPLPQGYNTAKDLIWKYLRDGWKFRWAENASMRARNKEYAERLKYEMELVEAKDFVDYFLMLSEGIIWAKGRGIAVGPARGSAAASLACYLLRITEVDPMQFPTMVFERFMDASREDLPDVDLDIADDRRHELRQHYANLYGAEHVANIGNQVKYKGKNAINDVARVYRLPHDDMDVIKALIVERSGGDSRLDSSLMDTIEMFPQAKEVYERNPALQNAVRLEGNYRGMNVHAAGLVISNAPVTDTCALYTREVGKHKQNVSVIPYDKKDAEYLGMLKADFLGLATMGMIGIALDIIGMKLEDLYRIPLDDAKTLKAFKESDVVGIFQFEGRATRLCCKEVSPDNFMEIADINALSRPGPLFSGTKTQYVDVKHGRAQPLHLHPIVDNITKHSKYQVIYQEQVLTIIREVGGFPVTKIADIRKIISQKLGEASFNEMKEAFQEGALRLHGIDEKLSNTIWKYLVTSATYSFNVAHCVSYSMLAFWCMWLKQHHPLAFYTAQLSKVDPNAAGEAKRIKLMKDAAKRGIRILPPTVASTVTWRADPEANAVRAGLLQIPGIGEKTAQLMVDYREQWKLETSGHEPFDWMDYTAVKGIGPKTMEKIQAFCEQEDPFGVDRMRKILSQLRTMIRKGELGRGIPNPTHKSDEIPIDADNLNVVWMGVVKVREYKDLIEDQRARYGEKVDEILKGLKDPHLVKFCVLKCEDDGEEEVYLRFNRWAYPKFRTALQKIVVGRDVVVVHGLKRKGFGVSLHVKNMAVINPESD
jgi:DNA polymerase-3 subunit alpha